MQLVTKSSQASLPARLLTLLVCGLVGAPAVVTAQSSGTFTRTSDMTASRSLHSATLLSNGQVLVAGGASSSSLSETAILASAEVYDPSAGAFRAVGAMTTARRVHTATLLPDGRVLIVGGYLERERSRVLSSSIR